MVRLGNPQRFSKGVVLRYPLGPHTLHQLFYPFLFFTAGDQLVVPIGVTHISCHYKNTIEETGENKKNKRTNTNNMLGVNQEQKESYATLCIPDSIYWLTLAWVTRENSTKQLECRLILTRSSSLSWTLSHAGSRLCSRCPESTASVRVPSPTATSSSFFQPTIFSRPLSLPVTARIQVQNPLSGFAPKQTKESSAWRATYIVL